jgi:hypothetical protein
MASLQVAGRSRTSEASEFSHFFFAACRNKTIPSDYLMTAPSNQLAVRAAAKLLSQGT